MIRSYFLGLLGLLFAVPLMMGAGSASKGGHELSCHTTDGKVVINFGSTRHPTYFGVQTPQDEFVYLRYPPRNIDVLGDEYRQDTFRLDVPTLQGVKLSAGIAAKVKVFATPGKYVLRFQDANRLEYEDLFELSCTVMLDSNELSSQASHNSLKSQTNCVADESSIITPIADTSGEFKPVGCNHSSGCGSRPCCNRSSSGGPCVCSLCCIARPPAEALAGE